MPYDIKTVKDKYLYIFRGMLINVNGEQGGLFLLDTGSGEVDDEPLAETFPGNGWQKKQVTVRYAINTKNEWPDTLDQLAADYLSVLEGESYTKYGAVYSELTGYLWTDEDLKVGGHDLLYELKRNLGKFLWMEVLVNKEY